MGCCIQILRGVLQKPCSKMLLMVFKTAINKSKDIEFHTQKNQGGKGLLNTLVPKVL